MYSVLKFFLAIFNEINAFTLRTKAILKVEDHPVLAYYMSEPIILTTNTGSL